MQIRGTDYNTADGTCVRDYIDVTDLIDAHVKALAHAKPKKVGIYNVGTGKGSSPLHLLTTGRGPQFLGLVQMGQFVQIDTTWPKS